ncbi:hypothetical protein MJL48_29685, partial [Salmonella enterica subsp. enterica serovar Kentucky]|nr:hypothetical protein [Salmonella enterica subsp. enterica serovar Kentucky]
SHVGRDLQLFNLLPPHIVDYLLLDSDLIANVHESLMDEMLTSRVSSVNKVIINSADSRRKLINRF